MKHKAIIIILFMYSFSFSALGVQYMYADVLGINMENFEGVEMKSEILEYIDMPSVNTASTNILGTNSTSVINNPVTAAAGIAWEIIQLMAGTYVFNLLALFGLPSIIIVGISVLYIILLAFTIVSYIRGV